VSVETVRIVKALPALDEIKPPTSVTYESAAQIIRRVAERSPVYGAEEELI
jgi:hypothetical protein